MKPESNVVSVRATITFPAEIYATISNKSLGRRKCRWPGSSGTLRSSTSRTNGRCSESKRDPGCQSNKIIVSGLLRRWRCAKSRFNRTTARSLRSTNGLRAGPGRCSVGCCLSEFGDKPVEETYYRPNSFEGVTIADPFMGGGTPLLEANSIGCDVIGTDINPMAAWIVREEIDASI